ncbi:DUF3653 domain-containing protein [Xanthomonas maliensis]|uniref:DUF3653 domain-containing protein n=1 Tax=Xanthomonas maliensis TaxID=1321368 RepID=UPI0004CF437D|nr:DUF3653 domain-containing protein [Xanthomonas maliensis]KAB7763928.1 hypothetical protein CKY51_18725 [Xanthomonas maliensis]
MKLDTDEHVDLTGPWAGFGFQGGRMFTPEGRDLRPADMAWWSLTCAIAREWSLMMSMERNARSANPRTPTAAMTPGARRPGQCKVIYLRDVLRRQREQASSMEAGAGFGADAPVGRPGRGRRRPRRG